VTVVSRQDGLMLTQQARTVEAAYPGRPFLVRTAAGRQLTARLGPGGQVLEGGMP
jgi:hypothetical protein